MNSALNFFDNGDATWKHFRKVHLNLYRYMCNLKVEGKDCPKAFKMDERAMWLYDKEVVHGVGKTPFWCKFCNRPMVQIRKIKRHKQVCREGESGKKEKIIDCSYCEKSFRNRQYYLNHIAVEHAEASGVTPRKHYCNTCGREYANSSALKNHVCRPKGMKRRPKSSTVTSTTDATE